MDYESRIKELESENEQLKERIKKATTNSLIVGKPMIALLINCLKRDIENGIQSRKDILEELNNDINKRNE